MNPLSPYAYYRRHKRSALLLVTLISLATLGVCVMVRLLDSLAEQSETRLRYLTRFSLVSAVGPSLEPGDVSQVRAHPGVARAIPEKSLYINVPMNLSGDFRLFGVPEADVQFLVDTCGLRLKEGRLLRAHTNELMLSEELAEVLGLGIGDQIGRSINEQYYDFIPAPLVLVGILESDPSATLGTGPSATLPSILRLRSGQAWLGTGRASPGQSVLLGFVSYEYVDSHELYMPLSSGLIVVAREGRKAEVDRFLETAITSPGADVWTYGRNSEFMAQGMLFIRLIFGVVDGLVVVVIALVVGTINRIALTQRTQELGLLHAVGHSRGWLIRRLTLEMAGMASVGWVAGLVLSWLLFAWLEANVFPPTSELNLANLTPIWFAVPIPLAVIAFVAFSTMQLFARFDAVAIIERDKLSLEGSNGRQVVKRSSSRPLLSWMFYLRHKRRGLALAVTIALMILGIAFPGFLIAPMLEANRFFFDHLGQISYISPRAGGSVDPGVTAQIRIHPAVARVIPSVVLGLIIEVPPVNRTTIRIYGVSEEDMQVLINLYGVELEEGRLPRPRSNEIVLSKAIAMNRGLRIGDKVGRPVYEYDTRIPTEMEVVGVLSRPSRDRRESDLWMGFASYEYLRSHELYSSHSVSLLVIPVEGRKDELDAWLKEVVASEQTSVITYGSQLSRHRQGILTFLLLFATIESVIAIVAAIALAVLSYIFFAQRREEFGILHALGHSRPWLVLRTVGETVSLVAVAWLIGAAVCMCGLVYMQTGLYAPKGLVLDFLNPTPWLFTLPIPVAVLAVTSSTVAWTLSKLDPVSIIERR